MITSIFSHTAKWSVYIETHGSGHLLTYMLINGFARFEIITRHHRINLCLLKRPSNWLVILLIRMICLDLVTSTVAQYSITSNIPRNGTPSDTEYERLRIIRRRAERRVPNTGNIDDVRNGRREQKYVRSHLGKLSKKCLRKLCAKLDLRLHLSEIW